MRRIFRLTTYGLTTTLASRPSASLPRVLRERRHTEKTTCGSGILSLNSMLKPWSAQAM